MQETQYLTLHDLVTLATVLMGDPAPIRDVGLLESASARPRTSVFGEEPYPSIWEKAAALLSSIVNNHPLVDGNKRLGWLATAVFVEINGQPVNEFSNEAVYQLVIEVASGQQPVAEIADKLRQLALG